MTQEEVGPELHTDFAFMGDEKSGELITIMVPKEKTTRMLMSTVASKIFSRVCAKENACFYLGNWCTHVATTVKSDNEPATSSMVTQIGKLRAANGGQGFSVEMSVRHFPAQAMTSLNGSANSSRESSSSPKRS